MNLSVIEQASFGCIFSLYTSHITSKIWKENRFYIDGGNSQFSEDLIPLDNFFFGLRGGTFLEMGALDGLKFSNSYFFEKYLDWSSIMIEGSPLLYEKLVTNRPGVVAINEMIYSEPQQLHWMDVAKSGRFSTAVGGAWELMSERFKRIHYPDITAADVPKLPTVPCVSLTDALARFGVRHFDLFSLDVEGAEVSVLKTLDFSKFSASVILLEMRGTDVEAYNFLRKEGYIDFGYHGWTNPNRVLLHPRFRATMRGKTNVILQRKS